MKFSLSVVLCLAASSYAPGARAAGQLDDPAKGVESDSIGESSERALRRRGRGGSKKDKCAKHKPTYSDVYVFGDSLSDVGNLAMLGIFPQFPPRHAVNPGGKFAAEYIAESFGLSASEPSGHLAEMNLGNNFAVVGARSTPVDAPLASPTDNPLLRLPNQVRAFLGRVQAGLVTPHDELYIVAMGGNDIVDAISNIILAGKTIEDMLPLLELAATTIAEQLRLLISAGAKHILVLEVPDIGSLPLVRINQPKENSESATELTSIFNQILQKEVESVECELDLNIMYSKADSRLSKKAKKEGLQDDGPCIIGPFGLPFSDPPLLPFDGTGTVIQEKNPTLILPPVDPSIYSNCVLPGAATFFLYDELHPTDAAHKLNADIIVQDICKQSRKKSKKKRDKKCKTGKSSSSDKHSNSGTSSSSDNRHSGMNSNSGRSHY